jgi:ATP-binding cassette subfamily C protein
VRRFFAVLLTGRRSQLAGVIAVQTIGALTASVTVLLLVPLLGTVGIGAAPGVSRTIKQIFVDVGIRPTLASILIVYIVLTAATQALGVYQNVLSTRYRLDVVNDLRGRLYTAVAEAQWRHLMSIRRADLLTVLTTNVFMVGSGAAAALGLIVGLIVIVMNLAASVQVSPSSTGVALASGAVLVWIVWPLARRSRRIGDEMVALNHAAYRAATGFLDALKLAKAYGRESEHQDAFMSAIHRSRDAQVSLAWTNSLGNAVQATLTALLLAVTVYVAIRVEHVAAGSLLVVAVVFTRVVGRITSSQSNIQQIALALPAFEELEALTADCVSAREPYGGAAPPAPIGSGVELQAVQFTYPDGTEALHGVSLAIPTGATVALAGPSGAGKTTLADIVAGLMLPTAGRVTIDGETLTSDRVIGWRRSVALVPQEPFMFHDTIASNLRFGAPDASDAALWEALGMASAAAFVGELPSGLETVVGDRGLRLSGGERQRLALARALLRDPELLILDEATSSLDTENELAIRHALSPLHGRTTILLIAHRLSTVSEADHIAVLDRGEVVEAGSWEQLAGREEGRLRSLIVAGALAPG